MRKKIAEHGMCFVCGSANPHGLGLTWYADEQNIIYSDFTLTEAQQGPPGFVHGGVSAAILDEAMGAAVWRSGHNVAVINLEINYHLPLPLGQMLRLEACMKEQAKRKISATGEIRLPDGRVAVSGKGLYVVAPQLFEANRYRDDEE